jgi:hypothetical protein
MVKIFQWQDSELEDSVPDKYYGLNYPSTYNQIDDNGSIGMTKTDALTYFNDGKYTLVADIDTNNLFAAWMMYNHPIEGTAIDSDRSRYICTGDLLQLNDNKYIVDCENFDVDAGFVCPKFDLID